MTAEEHKITDVVCGMDLTDVSDALVVRHKNTTFHFCGEECRERFNKDSKKFEGEPLVRLENLWKIFKIGETETRVLRGLNLRIWKGDFMAVIGSSGSGKSTLLNIIGLLDKPTSGRVFLRGHDASLKDDEEKARLRSKTFGFVFQQYNLIPWLSAYENVSLPLMFANATIDHQKIQKGFKEIGLIERADHRPMELSGGEQQRIALLRALTNDPEVIIGDEPTGNLDSATGNKILEMLINLNKVHGKTLIIVTHDADIADKADEIITLKDGQMIRDHKIHRKTYTE